jgi:hypothetical protein
MKIGDDLVKVDGDEVARVIHLLAELMEKNNVDGLVGIIAMRSLAESHEKTMGLEFQSIEGYIKKEEEIVH